MDIIKKVILFSSFLSLSLCANAATYYSRTSGGNWNDNTTWSTTGYGNVTNTGTFPRNGDIALIGDGYTVIVNVTQQVGSITIGQGTSGVVEYSDVAAYTLTVVNTLTINSGARLWYNGNSSRTHTLQVGTNLTNAGTLDLYRDADDVVNLVFYRSANSIVSGAGSFDLNVVNILKTISSSYQVEVTSTTFESAIRDLTINYGVYSHNNSSTYSVNSGAAFTIGADATAKVASGTLSLASASNEVTLNGKIQVVGGNLLIGSTSGNGGLRYDRTTAVIPRVDIDGGSMTIYGGINFKTGASADPFYFSMTAGSLLLNSGSVGTSETPFNINDVTGSAFRMTDGSIVIQNPNTTGSSVSDFKICGANGSVISAGGIIQFGNSSTPNGKVFTFNPSSSVVFPNIKISGSSSNAVTLKPAVSSIDNFRCISLYVDEGALFDARSVSGATGDDRTIELIGSMDGVNAINLVGSINFRSSLFLLDGVEGQQITGTGNYDISSLEINNPFGVSLEENVTISGQLILTNGIVYTKPTAKLILNQGSINDAGNSSAYIDGPFIFDVSASGTSSLIFPIGKDGSYRPLTLNVNHSSASTATYQLEVLNTSARDLNYLLPAGIDKVSNRRYFSIDRTGASNLTSAIITLSYDSDDGVSDYANLRVVQDDGATSWLDLAGTASGNTTGSITSSSFSSFGSKFTFGNATGGSNALPVSLVDFNVKKSKNNVIVSWVTLSEKNCSHFEIECKSNNSNFIKIGEVTAKHNSSVKVEYSFEGIRLLNEVNYYRLKIVDFDGSYAYSTIRVLKVNNDSHLEIYPNPIVNNNVNIKLNTNDDYYCLTVIDMNGSIIDVQNINSKDNIASVNLSNKLKQGMYIFKLVSSTGEEWNTSAMVDSD
jgi:hypothetical protein